MSSGSGASGSGVDPRVGGGSQPCRCLFQIAPGRSPRGRGKPTAATTSSADRGSIPAWAGEAARFHLSWCALWVDPRVGGGSSSGVFASAPWTGRSPRGRGKLEIDQGQRGQGGSIPAWAGEAGGSLGKYRYGRVDPRVGGGSLALQRSKRGSPGRSPRGRGKLAFKTAHLQRFGSIPAWAGEARACTRARLSRRVDPRVGGGSVPDVAVLLAVKGRSPRGRGKPLPCKVKR